MYVHTLPLTARVPTAVNGAPVVALHTGVGEFDASRWDALADPGPGGFYTSHRWIRSLELVHGAQPVLAASAGRLQGVLPLWTIHDDAGLFALPDMTQGLIRTPSHQMLWLGPRRATASAPLCTRGPARPGTLYGLLEAARRLAADRGLAGAVWPYLTGAHALEVAACHPTAQAVLYTADAFVTIPDDGAEGLRAAARSRERRNWRRERDAFFRSGTVDWSPLTADVAVQIAPLLAATLTKYGAATGSARMRRTLQAQLHTGVAGQALVARARTRGEDTVHAAAVFYRHGTTLYGRYWGTDGSAPPGAYFVLTIHQAIEWVASHGMHRLHLSVPATEAKTRRGAQVAPLALVYLAADAQERIDPYARRRHNLRTAQTWARSPSPEWSRWMPTGSC
ncbi:GNAT family N-acetyltransferase [Streptomyces sp. NPDC101062]|uniref:GNAT family N-acetyltransferase n=1 Tax=unclassified Streptomyces TaxID=2593676 RepID=UPI003810E484